MIIIKFINFITVSWAVAVAAVAAVYREFKSMKNPFESQ